MLCFAAAPFYAVALVALFLSGMCLIGFESMAQALVQLEAPEESRGKLIGLFNTSLAGLRVGSGFTVGFLGAVIGIHWSLGLSAALLLALAASGSIGAAGEPGNAPRRPDRVKLAAAPYFASAPLFIASDLGFFAAEGIAAMVFVPLCSAAGVIGKFMLYFEAPRRLSAPELTLADVIAAQVAFAVQRALAKDRSIT